jgi:hypothetical protein
MSIDFEGQSMRIDLEGQSMRIDLEGQSMRIVLVYLSSYMSSNYFLLVMDSLIMI